MSFLTVWLTGASLVLIQGYLAYHDGFLTENQMLRRHRIKNGYSFMQHGGMWADMFVISPLVAYIVSKYDLAYSPNVQGNILWLPALSLLLVSIGVCLTAGVMFARSGKVIPEAHAHDGKTTVAGWIHGWFAMVCLWAILMFYLLPISPKVPDHEILAITGILSSFFFLGATKFTSRWTPKKQDLVQVLALSFVLWCITFVRIWIDHG